MKLAIFKVNQLGDNVLFLPIVQTLRKLCPDWEILLFTSPPAEALYEADIPADHRVIMDTRQFLDAWKRPARLWRLLRTVRRFRPDACLLSDDQGNVSHFLARYSGARIRVGAESPFLKVRFRLTASVEPHHEIPTAELGWEIARKLMDSVGRSWPERSHAPDLAHLTGNCRPVRGRVVIHPGGSREYKRWPVERFAALAERLASRFEVVWIEPREIVTPALSANVRRIQPESLAALVQLLASAALFIGNNSGPMNLSFALGRPSVIINGPSTKIWDPYWHLERVRMLRDYSLPCLPCDNYERPAMVCVNVQEPMACMKRWPVETVGSICEEWMDRWSHLSELEAPENAPIVR